MAFVKLVKNNAHFKRYQTKYRRRREGKTDYRARKRLITQDKNKFNTPKYRMIVRCSNRYVTCQIAHATIKGDMILAQAHSKELLKYGLPGNFGLRNWTACYATGLLLARRVLKKLGLDELYQGQTEVAEENPHGDDYLVPQPDEGAKPFSVCLDVGLATTSTGARVFGALKGALDGGLSIPHSVRRWPACEKDSLNSELLSEYVYGMHVAGYMEYMEGEDEELYKTYFSRYHEADVSAENMQETWEAVHEKIRENPAQPAKNKMTGRSKKSDKRSKLNAAQRRDIIAQRMAAAAMKAGDE
jgi:large subunit ribosomal protein L5e